MKTKRFEGSDLRAVLIGMIVNQVTCARIAGQWTPEGLFDAAWANLVGGWCVKHFKKFGIPPGERIGQIFEMWADGPRVDEKTAEAVERFLQALSDQHSADEPTDFVLDLAGNYFNKVRLEREMEAAKLEIESGRISEAQLRLQRLVKVNLGLGGYVNVSSDRDAWDRAFTEDRRKPLVYYPGELGRFTEKSFLRGEFYSFLAPDKTGKTTALIDFAYRGVRHRNRVAYFDTGDSDEDEIIRRLGCRASGRPEWEGKYWIPAGWDDVGPIRIETPLEGATATQSYADFRKICVSGDVLRVSCHRNSTLTVQGLNDVLEDWARAGWYPDLVCCDYADILARPKGVSDSIQATNENWAALRAITQERHCLLVTATQTKATGYTKTDELLGPEDFSGSKGKNAHVNGMLGINVSSKDKESGIVRINWVNRRKGYYNVKDFTVCAGSMATGNPFMCSKKGVLDEWKKRGQGGSGSGSDDGSKAQDSDGGIDTNQLLGRESGS